MPPPNETGRSKRACPQATEPFPVVPAKNQIDITSYYERPIEVKYRDPIEHGQQIPYAPYIMG